MALTCPCPTPQVPQPHPLPSPGLPEPVSLWCHPCPCGVTHALVMSPVSLPCHPCPSARPTHVPFPLRTRPSPSQNPSLCLPILQFWGFLAPVPGAPGLGGWRGDVSRPLSSSLPKSLHHHTGLDSGGGSSPAPSRHLELCSSFWTLGTLGGCQAWGTAASGHICQCPGLSLGSNSRCWEVAPPRSGWQSPTQQGCARG